MGQVLHGSARTTSAVRAAIQRSQESPQALAARQGINPKTGVKWRNRTTTTDAAMGPVQVSTVLTLEREAIAVAFRKHPLLLLDDCRYALQAPIPLLSRSALHRGFQRHGISRLPLSEDGQSPPKKQFKDYPLAICTLILRKCTPKKASRIFSWPSTAPAKWPAPNSTPVPSAWSRLSFCGACSISCLTKCIPY